MGDTIDGFWEELQCKETVHLQNDKMQRQNRELEELQRQFKEAKDKLALLSAQKEDVDNQQGIKQKVTEMEANSIATAVVSKSKKKKKKSQKEQYQGLVGFFNRPNGKKKKSGSKVTENLKNED